MFTKKGNFGYTGSVPYMGGDVYYGQDMIRDHWYHLDRVGLAVKDLGLSSPLIISGGVVTKGTGDTLNITACVGYHKYTVSIPDSFAALPPSVTTQDVEAIRVSAVAQTNMALPAATLNGSAVNYIKLKYTEVAGNTRTRQKKAGSYSYEMVPSYIYVVSTVAPTAYEVCLGTLVGTAGGAFTIARTSRSWGMVRRKVIPIGSWDMNVGSTKSIAHGLSLQSIMGVTAVCFRDDGTLSTGSFSGSLSSDYALFINVDTTNINLRGTAAGGGYASADYNDTTINRGYVVIDYID